MPTLSAMKTLITSFSSSYKHKLSSLTSLSPALMFASWSIICPKSSTIF